MRTTRPARSYEKIKADLLAEAQAVGVHTKGAPLDPVLELLINGFSRELESIYERVDNALEHNRRTLLRSYFDAPFVVPPAQTVVRVGVKQSGPVGPDMRMVWQQSSGGLTPEYALLSDQEMHPLKLSAAFYLIGASVYRIAWDEDLGMTSRRYEARGEIAQRPQLILALTSSEGALDSAHLSLLLQPNDTGIPGIFPGADPQRSFCDYLDGATWQAADEEGRFRASRILARAPTAAETQGADRWSRYPTTASLFRRLEEEHLYARMVARFLPGTELSPGAVPPPIVELSEAHADLSDVVALSKRAIWLQGQLPFPVTEDPRGLFSLISANARLAVGYRRLPRDRFNFKRDDYNVQSELFEFGLADRPGQYCRSFGRWVVSSLVDQTGNDHPYVYEAFSRGSDRWFTLEAGADDVTLMVHVPRRRVPEVGHFDFHTGHVIGSEANTSRLDVLAPRPANALDFPEVEDLRLLVPALGGGDGHPEAAEGPDALLAGGSAVLARQYERSAVWLRTHDRLITMPDFVSYLRALDARVADVRGQRSSLVREDQLVPGVRLTVRFDEAARLSPEEQKAVCWLATQQIEKRVPIGVWIEVQPEDA